MFKRVFTSLTFYLYIGSIAVFGVATLLTADAWIMPWYTNYNQGVTVPDVTKMSMEEAEKLLHNYGLRFVVDERRPHEAFPPDYVIDQSPLGAAIVKPNRKVYLTVSTSDRPTATVPEVVNLSLNNARIQLQNHGLRVGSVTFESSRFRNAVLRQSIPGGTTLERGAIVDLVVSDGLGQRRVAIPDIVGLRLTEGQRLLRDAGLRVGSIQFRGTGQIEPNHILSFSPADSDSLFEGETLNLIVSEQVNVMEEAEFGNFFNEESDISDTLPADTLRPPGMPQRIE